MKQAVIILIIGGLLILGVIVFDKKQKGLSMKSNQEEKEAEERAKENVKLVEQENSIQHRASIYYKLSVEEKYKLWREIFEQCKDMKAVVHSQMETHGRDWNEQMSIEIDWYMNRKGRHPSNFLKSCK
ncbi:hypothetical protein [Lentimicrobium sp. S6]|uniref:hypothetical protein n=1 Tax=Lentimicrobium sp. S6 TaxID=2735872 RepID=UPI0015547963|nr:hypothetical protein [Lentimicrobium sp. S6]NPD47488.1 hypothetical protein [Lentimicrobium sp. S6]